MLETATIENVRVLPEDVHNQTLVSHVHPPDWVNPESAIATAGRRTTSNFGLA